MIKKLNIRIKPASDTGIFHDSRGDIRTLSKVCISLLEKVDELVDEVNKLKKELAKITE